MSEETRERKKKHQTGDKKGKHWKKTKQRVTVGFVDVRLSAMTTSGRSCPPLAVVRALPGSWLELKAPSTLTGARAERGSSDTPSRKVRTSPAEARRIGLSTRLLTKHTWEMRSGYLHRTHTHQMAKQTSQSSSRVGINRRSSWSTGIICLWSQFLPSTVPFFSDHGQLVFLKTEFK